MDILEERKPRITVLFSKLRLLTPRTIEYKTDYTYANIRLLICHGPATITSIYFLCKKCKRRFHAGEATQELLARSGQFTIS